MKKSAVVTAGLLVPLLVFAADRLNVKTGLWEITAATDTQGMPTMPEEVLARMTPEQRAKMAAIFNSREAGGASTHTSKECVTEQDLDKPFESQQDERCRTTVVKTTSTMQEADIVCSGEHAGTGRMRIETPTPETMNGMFEIKVGDGADAMRIKTRLTGKWLGPSCKGAPD